MPNFQLNSDVHEKLINLFTNRSGLDRVTGFHISSFIKYGTRDLVWGPLELFFPIFCFCDFREITNLGNIGLEKEIQYYFYCYGF